VLGFEPMPKARPILRFELASRYAEVFKSSLDGISACLRPPNSLFGLRQMRDFASCLFVVV
jgi:hypothetical protein